MGIFFHLQKAVCECYAVNQHFVTQRLNRCQSQVTVSCAGIIISSTDIILEGLEISVEADADKSADAVTVVSGGSATLRMCVIGSTTGSGLVVSGATAAAKVLFPPTRSPVTHALALQRARQGAAPQPSQRASSPAVFSSTAACSPLRGCHIRGLPQMDPSTAASSQPLSSCRPT